MNPIPKNLPIGTVFITRNNIESENKTPRSYWNHLAILVSPTEIVESQLDQNGVILTSIEKFFGRDYTIVAVYPKSKQVGIKAAEKAKTYVGNVPYKKISSIFKRPRPDSKGKNCISVVRDAYTYATGRDTMIRVPDEILMHTEIFTGNIHEVS